MNKKKVDFYFFALGVAGTGISGSDRIFIELARRWCKNYPLNVYTSYEGKRLCGAQGLEGKKLEIHSINNKAFENLFLLNYLYKILVGIKLGLTLKLEKSKVKNIYLYPASDFWMDVFPAILLKIRYKQIMLIATWFQTAPNPFKGYSEGNREEVHRLKAILYWFSQLPVKPLISMFADKVIVNNVDEKKRFSAHTKRGDTIVLIGAVPLSDIKRWLKGKKRIKREYDAVFQGRFHPQKGVVELIDIWKKVVDKKPDSKLGMIGDGPLMENVKTQISKYKLEKNIDLLGYVFDGDKKYSFFSSGKVVVHPAFYDSGGMAAAEAMAFGLPCVGFNLKAYESYYPKGMVKVRIGDLDAFAEQIIRLLEDKKHWERVASDARKMISKNWSWEKRAEEVFGSVTSQADTKGL